MVCRMKAPFKLLKEFLRFLSVFPVGAFAVGYLIVLCILYFSGIKKVPKEEVAE